MDHSIFRITALIALASVAGCADDQVSSADEQSSACACDFGWDYWGNPIPVNTTSCGYPACGLDDHEYVCSTGGWQTTGMSWCSTSSDPLSTKFGVNSAAPITPSNAQEARTAGLGMGHYLEIAYSEDAKWQTAQSVQAAIDAGVVPIVRICDASQCQFQDPASYVRFLAHIDDQVNGVFHAVAGANEPLTEKWIPGTENVQWNGGYTDAQLGTLGLYNAQYMNAVITGLGGRVRALGGQIALLSPVLNCTNAQMSPFVGKMHQSGAHWSRLSGIAGNAYNIDTAQGQTIGHFLAQCRQAFTSRGIAAPHDHFYLTEMGPYEITRGVPRAVAHANLRAQVELLRRDRAVRGALFYNAFGQNGSPDFAYGVIQDAEWAAILGDTTPPPPPPSCPCSSDPNIDNFCQYAPSTPSCPMTAPGGYCDGNANDLFDDADWTQGWYDYQDTCGS